MKKQVLSFLHFQFRKILLFLREKDEIFAFRFSLALFCNSPFTQVCSVLFDIHAGGGERKIHTVGLHNVHNVQVQVVLHLQKFRVGVGQ